MGSTGQRWSWSVLRFRFLCASHVTHRCWVMDSLAVRATAGHGVYVSL